MDTITADVIDGSSGNTRIKKAFTMTVPADSSLELQEHLK